jgi:hypothetical protein
MQPFIQDDELDRQLRDAMPYIDDAGFTAQVLQSLPSRPASARLRGLILILLTAVGSVLTYLLSGGGRFVNEGLARLFQLPMSWLLVLTFVAGIVVCAGGLAAAVFKTREPGLLAR